MQRCMELEAALQERAALAAGLRRELRPPRARATFQTRTNPSYESSRPGCSSLRPDASVTPASPSGGERGRTGGDPRCAGAAQGAAREAACPSCAALPASADGCREAPAHAGVRGSRPNLTRAAAGPCTALGSCLGSRGQQSARAGAPSAAHVAAAVHSKRREVTGFERRRAGAEPESTASKPPMRRLQERRAPGSRKRSLPNAAAQAAGACKGGPAFLEYSGPVLEGADRTRPSRPGPHIAAHAQHARRMPPPQHIDSGLAEACSCACSTSASGDHAPSGSVRACLQGAVQALADKGEQQYERMPRSSSHACGSLQGSWQAGSRAGGCRIPAGAGDLLAAVAAAAAAVSGETWDLRTVTSGSGPGGACMRAGPSCAWLLGTPS